MSNPLLALLNRAGAPSSSAAAPSVSPKPSQGSEQKHDADTSVSQDPGFARSPVSGPTSPSALNASSLLQNLLSGPISPSVISQKKEQPAASTANVNAPFGTTPSPQQSNPAAATAASDLLGLLSAAPAFPSTSPRDGSTAAHRPTTGASSASGSGATPAPAQPLFNFQSPFDDLLGGAPSPAQVKDGVPNQSSGDKEPAKEPVQQLVDTSDSVSLQVPNTSNTSAPAPPSPDSSFAAVVPSPSPPSDQAKVEDAAGDVAPSTPILIASKQLAALHQQGTFNSSETSGLQTDRISPNTTVFRLDLSAPQPGGLASLHPAKLEMKPLSAIEFTFSDSVTPVCGQATQENLPGSLIAQVPVPQVANLGSHIIAYSMRKGRIRVLHSVTGDRLLLQAEGNGKIRYLSASTGSIQGNTETWYVSTISEPKDKEGKQLLSVWRVWLQDRLNFEAIATADVQQWHDNTLPLLSYAWASPPSQGGKQVALLTCGPTRPDQIACCFRQPGQNSSQNAKLLDLTGPSGTQDHIVASSLSTDGSLAGVVTRASDSGALTLCLVQDREGVEVHRISIAKLPSEITQHATSPSVASLLLIEPKDLGCPRAALIGFQSNTILGLYDLQNRQWRFMWSFGSASSDVKLNAVAFDAETSTIAITNEQRSSLFNIQLKFDDLPRLAKDAKNADKHALVRRVIAGQLPWTIRVAPFVDEFALHEPIISFAFARGSRPPTEPGMKIFGIFPSGATTLMVPPVQRATTFLTWQAPPPAKHEYVSTQGAFPSSESEPGGPSIANSKAKSAPIPAVKAHDGTAVSTSDSDLDGPLVMLKSQRLKASRGGVREKEVPAEWDADNNAFSQLVSSETSAPASPVSKPIKARQTESPAPKKAARSASQGKKATDASDVKRNGAVATPPPTELAEGKSSVSAATNQPPPKSILTRPARQREDQPSSPDTAAIHDAIKGLEAKLVDFSSAARAAPTGASATTGPPPQLSASALSAIASEVGAAVSGEISGALTPQLLETMRVSAETSLRAAFAKDLHGVLPNELKKVIARSDVGDALTKSISQGVIPVVQKTAMDVVTRVLAPHFEETILGLTQTIEARVESSMTEMRKTLVAEQSNALKTTEQQLHAMTATLAGLLAKVESLASQNEVLQASVTELRSSGMRTASGVPDLVPPFGHRASATPSVFQYSSGHHAPPPHHSYGYMQAPQHTGGPWQPVEPFHSPVMSHHHLPHRPPTAQRGFPPFGVPPPAATPPLFGYSSSATPAPVPAPLSLPPTFASATLATPSIGGHGNPTEEVEDALLAALTASGEGQSELQLSTLLARLQAQHGRPDLALRFSSGGTTPVGGARGSRLTVTQPVLLTLLHRLAKSVSKGNGVIPLETAIPWAEATAASLTVEDATIAPAYGVVAGNIRQAFLDAWQTASVPWWTEDRLQTQLIRYLK